MRKKYLYVLICFLVSTLATANAANRTITGVVISGAQSETLGDCVKILIFAS